MPDTQHDQAKKDVERLILKFKQFQEAGQTKRLGEEETKKTFITPLFRALGWDMENDYSLDEVINEEKVSKGRVDYSFRINGIPKFFLEAKALNKGLDEAKDASQAINYAWHKGTSWAVLTDFQTLVIYNAEVKDNNLSNARFKTLTFDQFAEHFSELWLLSKLAFQESLLDTAALNWGKKLRKTKVGDQLLSELMQHRALLSKNIVKNNAGKNLSEEEVDEAVQRIIDRLIFIRTAEDRNIEPPTLLPKVREFEEKKSGKLTSALNEIYLHFDKTYNSKLFTFNARDLAQRHLCETIDIDNEVLAQVIKGLYDSKDGLTHYDFSAIDADVLGNIYEQYLSHILKKTDKRAKVESKEAHRKEQGIYYTPTYIVDYIVRNTLGEMLKNKKPDEVDKIKVLDMACGSGSFLLKAFDVLDDYYKKKDKNYAQAKLDPESEAAKITRKTKILKNNLYGVDLDPKAVEIAQLNLLLKAAETKHRLPDLRENIKCGNSLIDDPTVAGDRAFNWSKEFEGIMKDGGFDVVVGNPPYVRIQTMAEKDVKYFSLNYSSTTRNYDIYCLFVEQALKLLKPGGVLGYILPSKFFTAEYGEGLRKVISSKKALNKLVDFKEFQVFSGATTYTCLLFLKNEENRSFEYAEFNKANTNNGKTLIESDLRKSSLNQPKDAEPWILVAGDQLSIVEKLKRFPKLGDISKSIFVGVQTSADKVMILSGSNHDALFSKSLNRSEKLELDLLRPLLSGTDVKRYKPLKTRQFVIFPYWVQDSKANLAPFDEVEKKCPNLARYLRENKKALENRENGKMKGLNWYAYVYPKNLTKQSFPKICIPRLAHRINAVYDDGNFCLDNVDVSGVMLSKDDYEFVTAILNSKLLTFYLTKISTPFRGGFYSCNKQYLEQLPIVDASSANKTKLVELARKMAKVSAQLGALEDKPTDARPGLEKEFFELDQNLDALVYDLYGLTAEERRIVEEAVK
ncbi:hypothetical protein COX85_01860 [Candidatus Micrarchaeota archaeon CG_4_10_14_0_2_um_filter_55_9]|nr:MAG: hypothetical protein COX85_01860 [Candidatus Micrarchaeota archaeon CG_4_10_14_0_2_um_filter_55_9]